MSSSRRNTLWKGEEGSKSHKNNLDKNNNYTTTTSTSSTSSMCAVSSVQQHVTTGCQSNVWASGLNLVGQLGLGHTENLYRFDPIPPSTFLHKEITLVACGGLFTFFVSSDQTIWSCGSNEYGQLALENDILFTSTPMLVTTLDRYKPIKDIVAGNDHTIFLTHDGRVLGCGSNRKGQLGLPSHDSVDDNYLVRIRSPIVIQTGLSSYIERILCGNGFNIFVDSLGDIYTCGDNTKGQLGIGTHKTHVHNLVKVPLPSSIGKRSSIIASGRSHVILVSEDKRTVYSFGDNAFGQCGQDPDQYPILFTAMKMEYDMGEVDYVCCGLFHTLFRNRRYEVFYLGYRDPPFGPVSQPFKLDYMCDKFMKDIFPGYCHNFFLFGNGSLHGGGINSLGQLAMTESDRSLGIVCEVPQSSHFKALLSQRQLRIACGSHHNILYLTKVENEGNLGLHNSSFRHNLRFNKYWHDIDIIIPSVSRSRKRRLCEGVVAHHTLNEDESEQQQKKQRTNDDGSSSIQI